MDAHPVVLAVRVASVPAPAGHERAAIATVWHTNEAVIPASSASNTTRRNHLLGGELAGMPAGAAEHVKLIQMLKVPHQIKLLARERKVEIRVGVAAEILQSVADYQAGALTEGRAGFALEGAVRLLARANTLPGVQLTLHREEDLPVAPAEIVRSLRDRADQLAAEAFAELEPLTQTWSLPQEDRDWVESNRATVVYTDGSCMITTGMGGWAWWVSPELHNSGFSSTYSATVVERLAALHALRSIEGPVLIVSDAITPEWAQATGYERAGSTPTQLDDQLRALIRARGARILRVKGHSDCPGNLEADRLAGERCMREWAKVLASPQRMVRVRRDQVRYRARRRYERILARRNQRLARASQSTTQNTRKSVPA